MIQLRQVGYSYRHEDSWVRDGKTKTNRSKVGRQRHRSRMTKANGIEHVKQKTQNTGRRRRRVFTLVLANAQRASAAQFSAHDPN